MRHAWRPDSTTAWPAGFNGGKVLAVLARRELTHSSRCDDRYRQNFPTLNAGISPALAHRSRTLGFTLLPPTLVMVPSCSPSSLPLTRPSPWWSLLPTSPAKEALLRSLLSTAR